MKKRLSLKILDEKYESLNKNLENLEKKNVNTKRFQLFLVIFSIFFSVLMTISGQHLYENYFIEEYSIINSNAIIENGTLLLTVTNDGDKSISEIFLLEPYKNQKRLVEVFGQNLLSTNEKITFRVPLKKVKLPNKVIYSYNHTTDLATFVLSDDNYLYFRPLQYYVSCSKCNPDDLELKKVQYYPSFEEIIFEENISIVNKTSNFYYYTFS